MKQKLLDYLLQRASGATPQELLDLIFTSAENHPKAGLRFLNALLGSDPRFVWRAREGRWAASDHEPLARPLDEATFVVVDLETAGVGGGFAGIMEVGAVRIRRGRVVEELSQLVRPGVRLPPFVARLTGIDPRQLAAQPPLHEVWPRIAQFLGGDAIVAHNAAHDLGLLDAAAVWLGGAPLPNPRLCSLRLARRLLPSLRRSGLDALAAEFGIPVVDRHRALGDARLTAEIFFHLVERLQSAGVTRLDEALDFQNQAADGRPLICLLPRRKVESLPMAPGIYRFFDQEGKLLYVGRAKNLRERVSSYTTVSSSHGKHTLALIRRMRDVRVEVLGTELEAALEEAAAIRRERPPFNRLGKHLPRIAFIRVGLNDDFPRLSITSKLTGGKARYAGPFRNRREASRTLAAITRHFELRTCPGRLHPDESFTPCLQGQVGACTAPCAARVSAEDYGRQVERFLAFLAGDTTVIEDRLGRRAQADLLQLDPAHAASLQRDADLLYRMARRHKKLGWITAQQSFLLLQRAAGEPQVLAYGVIHGLLAVRSRLIDQAQIGNLAAELRRQLEQPRSEMTSEIATDGMTILAAWLRDNPVGESYVFPLEKARLTSSAVSEWAAACASMLQGAWGN